MKTTTTILLHILLLISRAVTPDAVAQQYRPLNLRFSSLGIEDGLSQGMIHDMLLDKQGFMWFGTKEGLNRYDGYGFTAFRLDPTDSNSLADNHVLQVAQDGRGRFWISMLTGGLQLYDPSTGIFRRIPIHDPDGQPLKVTVNRLVCGSDGSLWMQTALPFLIRLNTQCTFEDGVSPEYTFVVPGGGVLDRFVFQIGLRADGVLYAVTDRGVFLLDSKHQAWNRLVDLRHMLPGLDLHPSETVNVRFQGRDTLWVAGHSGRRHKLFRLFSNRQSVVDSFTFDYKDTPLALRSFVCDASGILWLSGSYNLIRFDPMRMEYAVAEPEKGTMNALQGSVACLLIDHSGMLWIGTTGLGICTFNPQTLVFHADVRDLKAHLFEKELLALNAFLHNRFDAPPQLSTEMFPVRAPDGSVWCGTLNYGLLHYDPRTGTVKHYGINQYDPYSFLMVRLGTPFIDSRNRVWIGNGYGVSRVTEAEEQWVHYFFDAEGPSISEAVNGVQAFLENADGTIWLGTMATGLVLFDPNAGTFRSYRNAPGNPNTLSMNHVLSIAPDPRHPDRYIWIGTDGGGLNRFNRIDGSVLRMSMKTGLPNDVIYGILADQEGNLWMSTNYGIACLDPERMNIRTYDIRDGLQGNEFNRTEYLRIGSRLYFGGTQGFNAFDPREIRQNTTIPAIVITGVRVLNHALMGDGKVQSKTMPAGIFSEATLSHDENMITFEFSALDFSTPEKNRYRYKLEGYDRHWIDAGNAHSVTFTNLDPGTYTFRVIGSNNHGVWNMVGTSFQLHIQPPWWRSSLAYIVYFVLLIGLVFLVDRVQRRRIQQRERGQALVREAELRAEKAELEIRAVKAENQQKQQELRLATEIQARVIPRSLPSIPGYDVAGVSQPALSVGGDFYDCLPLFDGRFALVIADVSGKGVPAALLVNSLHAALLNQIDMDLPLTELAGRLNTFLYRTAPPNAFITFLMVVLSPETGEAELLNAGHNPAMIRRASGEIAYMRRHGLPLGCTILHSEYQTEKFVLDPGDSLLLYTDGITEAMDKKMNPYGDEALEQFLRSHADLRTEVFVRALLAEVLSFSAGTLLDDITALSLTRDKAERHPFSP